MKVLVTGGAGYIGSVLVRKLLEKGNKIVVLDNLLFGGESLIAILPNPNLNFIKGDIRDKKSIKHAIKGVEGIIHLAAIVGEHACKPYPKKAQEINYTATCLLADMAKSSGVKRFIFASTCSNYGISDQDKLATENSPLHPISLYAETKVNAEKYILSLTSTSFHPTILRISTVFGLSPRMRFDLLVSEFIKDAMIKKSLTVYKPNAFRPLIHIQDLANGIFSILSTTPKKVSGEIFNLGFNNYRKRDIIEYIKLKLPKTRIRYVEGKGDNRDYRVSFEKAEKVLNFKAKLDVKAGVDETINAIKNGIFRNIEDSRFGNYIW